MSERRGLRRFVIAAAIAAFLALAVLVLFSSVRGYLERRVADWVREVLPRSCAVRTLRLSMIPPKVGAGGVKCGGPFLEAEELQVRLDVASSLRNRELRFFVRAHGVLLDWRLEGAEDQSAGEVEIAEGWGLPIAASFEVEGLAMRLPYPGLFDVDLSAQRAEGWIRVRPRWDRGEMQLAARFVRWQRGNAGMDARELDAKVQWNMVAVQLEQLRVQGDSFSVAAQWDGVEKTLFRLHVPVLLVGAFLNLPEDFGGELEAEGSLEGSLLDPRVEAVVMLRNGVYRNRALDQFSTVLLRAGGLVSLERARGRFDGGDLSGEALFSLTEPPWMQVALSFRCGHTTECEGIQLLGRTGPVARPVAGELLAVGALDPLSVEWSAGGQISLADRGEGQSYNLTWGADGHLDSDGVATGGTLRGESLGTLGFQAHWRDNEVALFAEIETEQVRNLIAVFGARPALPAIEGRWKVVGQAEGPMSALAWRAHLLASSVRVGQQVMESLRCKASGLGRSWKVEECDFLQDSDKRLQLSLVAADNWTERIRMRARANAFSLDFVWALVGSVVPLGNLVSGGVVTGAWEWPTARENRITIGSLRLLGEPIREAQIVLGPLGTLGQQVHAEIELLEAGKIVLSGQILADRDGRLEIKSDALDVSRLRLARDWQVAGRAEVTGEMDMQWPPEHGAFRFLIHGVGWRGWELGEVDAGVTIGVREWRLEAKALEGQVVLSSTVQPGWPLPFDLGVRLNVSRIVALERRGLSVALRGGASLRGQLAPWKVQLGEVELTNCEFRRGFFTIRLSQPFVARFDEKEVAVPTVNFELPGGRASFSAFRSGRNRWETKLRADADISWISGVFAEGLAVGGHVTIAVDLERGEGGDWRSSGEAQLVRGSFEREGMPAINDAAVFVRLEETQVPQLRASGILGRGRFDIHGRADLNDGPALVWEIHDVELEDLAGWEAVLEGRGTLNGGWDSLVWSGDLVIERAEYRADVGLLDLLAWLRERWFVRQQPPIRAAESVPLAIDLKVYSSGGVAIRNNIADVELWVDTWVRGPVAAPQLGGRIGVLGGQVSFQGRSLEITQGVIEFLDPNKPDPWIHIVAETEVRSGTNDYWITVTVEGPSSAVAVRLAADDPALAEDDILSLLLFGRPRAELQASAAGVSPLGMAIRLVPASLIERPVTEFLGVDRFEVSAAPGRDTAALEPRLTVGKAITEQLLASVVSTVGFQSRQSVQLEYRLARRVSLLGSWESGTTEAAGAFGVELKFRLESYRVPFSVCQ